jgi:hypothetical protein
MMAAGFLAPANDLRILGKRWALSKGALMMTLKRRDCSLLLSCCLVAVLWISGHSFSPAWAQAGPPEEAPPPPEAAAALPPAAPETPAPLSNDELDQLVAPIALYPDALVAQILAGATYPTEVVEAARWQGANSGLSGNSLATAVDSQNWDPSLKALTQFPSVLMNMNNNLSWTSALGQAYYYQPEAVLNAVQVMRQRALAASTLANTPQQTVVNQDGTVMIEPVNPNIVYVPAYNPADVYGAPEAIYPGYSMGEMIGAGVLAFGAGVAVGVLASQAWGWHGWNTDWHHHHVTYQNNVYVSNTNTFASVGSYGGGGNRGGNFNRAAGNNRQGGFNASVAGRPQEGNGAGYRPGAPANRPVNANREVANGGQGRMSTPAEAHPAAGARPASRPATAAPTARNNSRPEARQANPYRGFAKAPVTGLNKTAFAGIAPGGEAIAASARGRTSLGRAPKPVRAAPPAHSAARPARPAARSAPPSTHKR